jgi:hypothetical protein
MRKILHRVVVVDVIVNPARISLETREKISTMADGEKILSSYMPRNSILGVFEDSRSDKYQVFYPFFSSHFSTPVKPGEHVWVIFDKPGKKGIGYWITRIHGPASIEDLNYTHLNRWESVVQNNDSVEGDDLVDYKIDDILAFPKGGHGKLSRNTVSESNDYEIIFAAARATEHFTAEPVPRFSKRCGDLVLQGSNNARIVLGEDRHGSTDKMSQSAIGASPVPFPVSTVLDKIDTVNDRSLRDTPYIPPGSIPNINGDGMSGTIDLVVGAGMRDKSTSLNSAGALTVPAKFTKATPPGITPAPDSSMSILAPAETARGYFEIEKNPDSNFIVNDNPHEGDPDFETDLARIYVSMRCNVDQDFGISEATVFLPLMSTLMPEVSSLPSYISGEGASSVVAHADRVRLIARAAGDIKIVKKASGDSYGNGSDEAHISLSSAGDIQICSEGKVHIGSAGGYGKGTIPPNGDPYILYSKLQPLLSEIISNQSKLAAEILLIKAAFTAAAPAFTPIPTIIFSPFIGLQAQTAASAAIGPAAIAVQASDVTLLADTMRIGSAKIYGE